MSNYEIATELTLKAIEHGYVVRGADPIGKTGQEFVSTKNTNTAKEIADFFNTILDVIENGKT